MENRQTHHIHISARHDWFDLKLHEVWQYRDLVLLFTRRALTVSYKQTILGPLWLLLRPLLTSIMFTLVFGHIAGIGTNGVPRLLFYLCGNALWGYFAACLSTNASVFTGNAGLFGKVYFPRLAVPLSNLLTAAAKLGVQMVLVSGFLAYYLWKGAIHPQWQAWLLLPPLMVHIALLGMGCGIVVSSLTTKYRDLSVLVEFGISLWMFATPVVYPLSEVTHPLLRVLVRLNPVTMPMELYRYALLGVGSLSLGWLLLSCAETIVVTLLGIALFNRVERTFMDTV